MATSSNNASPATAARRGRKPAPENETEAQRFSRIASLRVSNVLDAIDLVGNLSSGYERTPAQIEVIFKAIQGSVDSNRARFTAEKAEQPKRFSV